MPAMKATLSAAVPYALGWSDNDIFGPVSLILKLKSPKISLLNLRSSVFFSQVVIINPSSMVVCEYRLYSRFHQLDM